jgi:hypothetical protein
MIKIILTILSLTLTTFGAVVVVNNNGRYLHTTTTLIDDGWFEYIYVIQPKNIELKNLSFFEVFFCDDAFILSPESTLRFKAEYSNTGFKWDSLKGDNDDIVYFTFLSKYAPILGDASFKMGRTTYFDKALVPSCVQIPEVSTLGFFGLGLITILRRKR